MGEINHTRKQKQITFGDFSNTVFSWLLAVERAVDINNKRLSKPPEIQENILCILRDQIL